MFTASIKGLIRILIIILIIFWLFGITVLFLPKKKLLVLKLFFIKDKFSWIIGPIWTFISVILLVVLIIISRNYFKKIKDKLKNKSSFILLLGLIIIFFASFIMRVFGVKIDVQSFTSFLSVCVAALSFYVTNSENQKKEEQSQAEKVSCWLLPQSKKDEQGFNNEQVENGGSPRRVIIENASQLPLYEIFIFSMSNRSGDNIKNLCKEFSFAKYIGLLPPGKSTWYVKTRGAAMGGARPRAAMTFRDCSSQWWYRGPQGRLSKITQEEVDKLVNSSGIYYPLFDGSIYSNNFFKKDDSGI